MQLGLSFPRCTIAAVVPGPNENGLSAGRVRSCDVAVAVADQPRPAEVEVMPMRSLQEEPRLGLAAITIHFQFGDFPRPSALRVMRAEKQVIEIGTRRFSELMVDLCRHCTQVR